MIITKATNCYELRRLMKQTIFDWLELREQNLKKLSYTSIGEQKIRYLAQIDFIETIRVNIGAIIDKLETVEK